MNSNIENLVILIGEYLVFIMKSMHIGKRIIKTFITLFLVLMIYILLLFIDKLVGIDRSSWKAPSNMYTPFFAGIAAVFATHRNKKSSKKQATVRSLGTIIGGYFGMAIILLFEFILIDLIHLDELNFILYSFLKFLFVSICIIPLILVTIKLKQVDAVFITCLTYLSVTISIRNGGMPVLQFATNRVLSTLIGVGVSLFVNNYLFTSYRHNNNILFVSSLDNNFLSKDDSLSPYIKYKLNDMYYHDMPLVFATTRTMSSLEYIFSDVEVNYPMVVMNGSAIYHYDNETYERVFNINKKARRVIEYHLKNNNMNAFTYTINNNILQAYHNVLVNDGEKLYYQNRLDRNVRNFVRGKLPSDLEVSLYIIIDTKENIDKLTNILNETNIKDDIDLVTYLYHKDINGVDYWYLKINSRQARKENLIQYIKDKENKDMLVVCGAGHTDLPLIEKADLSMCLENAPDYIKEKVDIVIDGDTEKIIRIFDKMYHSYNPKNTITKLISEYNNKKE